MNRDESVLCLESTAPPTGVQVSEARQLAGGDHSVEISMSGLGLAMAPDGILVADGLIRRIAVGAPPLLAGASPLGVTLQVILEHAVRPAWTVIPGMPVLSEFSVPREPLQAFLAGRTIAIDPGHGGKDAGVRGPVDLLEKDVALAIALHLRDILAQSGTYVLMSREDDCDVDPRTWAMALAATTPDLLVEIHVSGVRDPMARTYRIYARTGSEASFKAAKEIAGGLTERMGITFGSIDGPISAIPLCRP